MFSRRVPAPAEVFTPTTLPLQEHNAYVHRSDAEAKIERYLSRGQVPLIYGEYGVGKTTVARKVLRDRGFEPHMVYMPTTASKSISDVIRLSLEHLGATVTVESVRSTSTEGGLSASFVVELGGRVARTTQDTERFVVDTLTDERALALFRDNELTIVIDELHRASPEFRGGLADLIKASHGQEDRWPQIVLIGTSADATALVRADAGIDRFVKELRLPTLTATEARALVTTGFTTLQIEIDDSIVELVVRTAAGAPSLLQSVCLDMAESAVARSNADVSREDYQSAVRNYLDENTGRLNAAYTKAIEHTGPKRYRKQILIAMSQLETEYPELEEIRARIEENLGERVEQTALSGPLKSLKTGPDRVLVDVERYEGGRVHNVSTFLDPMMKSFVRFITEAEAQGLLGPT
ncbi:AAA family ATPase [Cellulosimicrobium sp. KWT-B]|uniref:AAA family ATPase n=1 Tax=Cellulosimicrobium sp. KWT-B TaxID=1981152 RepID=UPI000A328423|nr:AAA family ATPase [Cellulosimicrobium sp. KWT-B]